MPTDIPEHARQFIADCNLARHGWARFQDGNRRAVRRMLAKLAEEPIAPRYEVRTIEADPAAGEVDFHKAPPVPVYYVHDTLKGRPVPLSSSHDGDATARRCAELNDRA